MTSTRRLLLVQLLACWGGSVAPVLAAEGFSPLGEWSALSTSQLDQDAHGGVSHSRLTYAPGMLHLVVTSDHIRVASHLGGEDDDSSAPYAVIEKASDHWIVQMHPVAHAGQDPGSEQKGPITFSEAGGHLIGLQGKQRTEYEPWTADVAKRAAQQLEQEHAQALDAAKPPPALHDGPISGIFDGKAWTATRALQSDIQMDEGLLDVTVLSSPPADQEIGAQGLLLSLPLKTGRYPLGEDRSATFYTPPNQNIPATNGELVIESVDAHHLTFSITVRGDHDHALSGHATVTRHAVAADK